MQRIYNASTVTESSLKILNVASGKYALEMHSIYVFTHFCVIIPSNTIFRAGPTAYTWESIDVAEHMFCIVNSGQSLKLIFIHAFAVET